MTHITIEKEKLEQVLGALEKADTLCPVNSEAEIYVRSTHTAIKEALVRQEGQSNYCLQCEALSRELAALKARQSNEQVEHEFKPMPREATREMLEAMDECSMEGYDERLYAGHASSVYRAAWDAFTHPPLPTAQPKEPEQEAGGVMCAIVNARTYIDRLEQYGFECEVGPLSMCVDWMELRRLLDLPTEKKGVL